MIDRIKSFFIENKNKKLRSNVLSLTTINAANFILPLLAVPYLVRVLGVELYGLLALATATNMYFLVLSDYGFTLTATRDVAVNSCSQEKLNKIYSSVMITKLVLSLIGFLILMIVVFSINKMAKDYEIYLLSFGVVIGQSIFPVWFFQGMEKMKYISVINMSVKALFLFSIFIFVKSKDDILLAVFFNSIGYILSGLLAQYYLFKVFKVRFQLPRKSEIIQCLIDGWHVFISRVAVVFYTSSNVFVLGMLTNNMAVGYYAVAEKAVAAIATIGSIINQAVFPKLSQVWKNDSLRYLENFYLVLKILTVAMLCVAIGIFLFSDTIIYILSGSFNNDSIIVLRILAITVLLIPLGGLFTQNFVLRDKSKYVTRTTIYTCLFNLSLVFILIDKFGVLGLAITVLSVQSFQVIINSLFLHRANMECS